MNISYEPTTIIKLVIRYAIQIGFVVPLILLDLGIWHKGPEYSQQPSNDQNVLALGGEPFVLIRHREYDSVISENKKQNFL